MTKDSFDWLGSMMPLAVHVCRVLLVYDPPPGRKAQDGGARTPGPGPGVDWADEGKGPGGYLRRYPWPGDPAGIGSGHREVPPGGIHPPGTGSGGTGGAGGADGERLEHGRQRGR